MNRTLELRPKRLHAVGVDVPAHKLPCAVVHSVMGEPVSRKGVVAAKLIGIDRGTSGDFGRDIWNQRHGFAVWNRRRVNLAVAFDNARYRCLARRSAPALAGPLAADVSFVSFHNALQQHRLASHKLADLMVHSPCGLVANSRLPHEFHCGHPVAAGHHNKHGMEPTAERSARLVKDCSGSGRNLETAPGASELLASIDTVKAIRLAALASSAVWKPLVKQILQAIRVVRELLVELFDCVFNFHANRLAKALGHPLSKWKLKGKFVALNIKHLQLLANFNPLLVANA